MGDEKESKWYVQEGVMCSGDIIATMDFSLDLKDDLWGVEEVIGFFFDKFSVSGPGLGDTRKQIAEMAKKPGKWFLLTGMQVVHNDDLFDTKEEAAKHHYNQLMG